ncbi:DUF5026 domain-containing protein [Candidatus Merdisoma sp. JLR.KK006]|uniref:DUF5026 domain-containing protein n=1 Tax=Candidatus Merdisoma sp. JLR.KK006 TaxID=3112626 RepID=UPI002FF1EE1D
MLLTEKSEVIYELSQIQLGYLVYAKHYTWDSGRAGFVTSATEKNLTIQYHPGIGNVTNHFHIPVEEAAAGQWEIRWSQDMSQVFEYRADSEEKPGTEGKDELGRIDL